MITVPARAVLEGVVIGGSLEDRPNMIAMAMNGWGAAEPAWWLNLQAHLKAVVELAGGVRSGCR